ncbi:hypothetical protein PBI_HOWE_13 [Gordonia phage Howe]|uniref:Uncharacterized protein n=1 Tax=Gordonia phage Howe TaxID=1777061 RepID=A0A0U4IHT1_9CAUD|nr:hypothetical protein PP513_gp13 [Gordonia phage Howe]ALY07647.1 hypothetical protein PBI_HOWE_13 [Gordonia phage Howe]QYC54414.1 hypothetical protein SEA_SHLIM410_13 [Gordonia phage Shlim410]
MAVPESDLFSGTASDLGGEPEPVADPEVGDPVDADEIEPADPEVGDPVGADEIDEQL